MRLSRARAKSLGIPLPKAKRSRKRGPKQPSSDQGRDKLFDQLCAKWGLPIPVHEYQFHPERKWRFDYLFDGWLALEVEGGVYTGGRHTRGEGFLGDIEKYNAAAIMGFTVIRCTPEEVESGAAFALVKRALASFEEMA